MLEIKVNCEDDEMTVYDDGKLIGHMTFPKESMEVVLLNEVYLKEEYRGQGITQMMMEEFINSLEKTKRKVRLICPFAKKWFRKNPQYSKYVEGYVEE
ncbi:MAG: N-acetyltransferase [Clostridiales bacterium]|nr:N-acetyltransferase [Clostridiales bacterium]